MSLTFKIKEPFWHNFDLSVVIPFYHKMKEFRQVFPKNRKYFERNGIEVVIVLDTPDESQELLDYISQYPFINWKVVINEKPHEWRNPAKPLNVGIRQASKRYVMVCSPESEMVTDVIYILRKSFFDYAIYPHYAIGRVCFADEEDITECTFDKYQSIPFGSIMFEKAHAEQIRGYDETLLKWGGDDNNIRSRFEMNGIRELYFSGAMMAHRDIDNKEGKIRRGEPFEKLPNVALRHFFFPETACVNGEDWGTDFDKIIFDWRYKPHAEKQLNAFSESVFTDFYVQPGLESKEYPVLLLVQSYNESKRIVSFIDRASECFDAIILLDDGSSDNTYELANNEKLIFKGKKVRTEFNDLQNRNLLLDLASFVNHKIAFFLDVDECLDSRFSDVRKYADREYADSFMIPYIHLWDSPEKYNAEYPSSLDGICFRYKMIRNIGHSQIYSNRGKLHFHQAHSLAKSAVADDLLICHYGLMRQQDRSAKYEFYKVEDKECCQSSYEHFGRDVSPRLKEVDAITAGMLHKFSKQLISGSL